MSRPFTRKQAGVALVMVLWVTVLMTIMAGSFTLTIHRESALLANVKAKSQANAFAEAGVYYAMMMLQIDEQEIRWQSNGRIYEFPLDEAIVRVRIFDEAGKVDLNYAKQETLFKLFQSLELDQKTAEQLTDAVMDWRDKDDQQRENGAEKRTYEGQGLFYGPRNGAFKTVEELQWVHGMTPQYYKKLEPMITVHANTDKVNFSKAPEQVLLALMDDEDKVIEQMQTRNISSMNDLFSANNSGSVGAGEDDSSSGILSVLAEAELPDGQRGNVFAMIKESQNGVGFDFLRWKKNADYPSLFTVQTEYLQTGAPQH